MLCWLSMPCLRLSDSDDRCGLPLCRASTSHVNVRTADLAGAPECGNVLVPLPAPLCCTQLAHGQHANMGGQGLCIRAAGHITKQLLAVDNSLNISPPVVCSVLCYSTSHMHCHTGYAVAHQCPCCCCIQQPCILTGLQYHLLLSAAMLVELTHLLPSPALLHAFWLPPVQQVPERPPASSSSAAQG